MNTQQFKRRRSNSQEQKFERIAAQLLNDTLTGNLTEGRRDFLLRALDAFALKQNQLAEQAKKAASIHEQLHVKALKLKTNQEQLIEANKAWLASLEQLKAP